MIRGTCILFSLVLCAVLADFAAYENTSIVKTVNLSNSVTKVTLRIAIHASAEVNSKYEVAIPKSEFEHLSYIDAATSKKVSLTVKMERVDEEYAFSLAIISRNDVVVYSIGSDEGLADKTVILVHYYLTQVLTPLPAMVHQVCLVLMCV